MDVYKYFHNKEYAQRFIEHGEVMFQPLSYYQNCENDACKDVNEGANIYAPAEGLVINTSKSVGIIDGFLKSKVDENSFFVFCTSKSLSDDLKKGFGAQACVKINGIVFQTRLVRRVGPKRTIAGEVVYYDEKDLPGARYAVPEQIVLSKQAVPFKDENEYRFAFTSKKKNLKVNNLNFSINQGKATSVVKPVSGRVLRLGSMVDIATMIDL